MHLCDRNIPPSSLGSEKCHYSKCDPLLQSWEECPFPQLCYWWRTTLEKCSWLQLGILVPEAEGQKGLLRGTEMQVSSLRFILPHFYVNVQNVQVEAKVVLLFLFDLPLQPDSESLGECSLLNRPMAVWKCFVCSTFTTKRMFSENNL